MQLCEDERSASGTNSSGLNFKIPNATLLPVEGRTVGSYQRMWYSTVPALYCTYVADGILRLASRPVVPVFPPMMIRVSAFEGHIHQQKKHVRV